MSWMINSTYAIISIFIVSLASLLGLSFISLKEKILDRILIFLVAFGTGTILATAIFDLIPEAIHYMEEINLEGENISEFIPFVFVMIGYLVFYVLERFIYWFHGHAHQKEDGYACYEGLSQIEIQNLTDTSETNSGNDKVAVKGIKDFVILNLIGDAVHNFLDGVIIMIAFLTGVSNGLIILVAVLFHEIPQEIGDFGILLYGGLSKKKALLFNFSSALTSLIGGFLAYFLTSYVELFSLFIIAFSGGGFLYIACTELFPELSKEKDLKKSIINTIIILVGILFIYLLINILPHE
ncbi:MAG: ZIP family metal transporter [Promethearchaeota archaeon]